MKRREDLLKDCISGFEEVVVFSLKRAVWNYRTLVPYYRPQRDNICFVLPLYFEKNSSPCCAIVLEQDPNDFFKYNSRTVVTLEMAYLNARLVCRPEADWLNEDTFTVK